MKTEREWIEDMAAMVFTGIICGAIAGCGYVIYWVLSQ